MCVYHEHELAANTGKCHKLKTSDHISKLTNKCFNMHSGKSICTKTTHKRYSSYSFQDYRMTLQQNSWLWNWTSNSLFLTQSILTHTACIRNGSEGDKSVPVQSQSSYINCLSHVSLASDMSLLFHFDSVDWFSPGLFEKSGALTTVFLASLPICTSFCYSV